MVLVICQNTVMITTDTAGAVTISTDPIPLEGNDRAYLVTNIHYMFGATTRRLRIQPQYSNDGTNWVNRALAIDYTTAGATPAADLVAANSTFLRFQITFEVLTGSGTIATSFDMHARMDHS